MANEAPFHEALHAAGDELLEATPVLPPERYAALLDELGFADQHVRLQVYGHHLASTADVAEWTKGTTLTRYERGLPPDLFVEYVDRYRARLLATLGEHAPYFYTFKRLLFWGRLPRDRVPSAAAREVPADVAARRDAPVGKRNTLR